MDLHGFSEYYQKGSYKKNPGTKVFVIGDVHGDLRAFIYSLRLANVINKDLDWVGGMNRVVQIGDIMDRKTRIEDDRMNDEDSEFKIIALMLKLQYQSYKAGGGFHCIIGNHELMNVMGVHDYVSPEGHRHFLRGGGGGGRREFFEPGGHFARYLACTWNPVVKIGDWVFCHGGISPKIASAYKMSDINLVMRDYLYGNKSHAKQSYFKELFTGNHSILWNRDFAVQAPNADKVKRALESLGAKHMVVGHTIQSNGITSRYGGAVWNVDTGMSEAFGRRRVPHERVQILEINAMGQGNIMRFQK
jgi:hypothetical protein